MLPSFRRTITLNAYKRLTPVFKNKKSISYFTITLSLFSLSFFGLFAIRPTLITAISLNKDVSELKKLNLAYENKISSIVRAQSEYEQIRNSIPLIEAAIPNEALFNKVARALEDFAQRENVVINQLQIDSAPISKPALNSALQKYNFNMIATGSYSSIFSYLSHLTNWNRLINISTLDLSQEDGTTSGKLKLAIKGATYYEP